MGRGVLGRDVDARGGATAEQHLLGGPEELGVLEVLRESIPHVSVVDRLGAGVVLRVPRIRVDPRAVAEDARPRVGVAPHAAAVDVVEVASRVDVQEIPLGLELVHPLGHVEQTVQVERAVGVVVGLGGVAGLGQLPPQRIEPRPVPDGARHVGEHADGDRRAGVDAEWAVVGAALDHRVVGEVDPQALVDEPLERRSLLRREHVLPDQLRVDAHAPAAAPGLVTAEETEAVALAGLPGIAVAVEDAEQVRAEDLELVRLLAAAVDVAREQPIPLPAAAVHLRSAPAHRRGERGDLAIGVPGIRRPRVAGGEVGIVRDGPVRDRRDRDRGDEEHDARAGQTDSHGTTSGDCCRGMREP